MKQIVRPILLPLLYVTTILTTPYMGAALAHQDKLPVWAMSAQERTAHEASLNNTLSALKILLDTPESTLSTDRRRHSFFDLSDRLERVDRSRLTQILNLVLEAELSAEELELFGNPNSCQSTACHTEKELIKSRWRQISANFTELAAQVSSGVKLRWMNWRSFLKYKNSRFQIAKNAYGTGSALLGATVFTTIWLGAEALETSAVGPFHGALCQLNTIWSIAIASALAGVGRSIQANWLYDSKARLSTKVRNLAIYLWKERAKQFASRRVVVWELNGTKQTQAQTVQAISEIKPHLPELANIFIASPILWVDIFEKTRFRVSSKLNQQAFDPNDNFSLKEIFTSTSSEWQWRDLIAALRILIELKKEKQLASNDGADQAQLIGKLDRHLNALNWLGIRFFQSGGDSNKKAPRFVSEITNERMQNLNRWLKEWTALLLSDLPYDILESRIQNLEVSVKSALRAQDFVTLELSNQSSSSAGQCELNFRL